jgi:hypothetical protein
MKKYWSHLLTNKTLSKNNKSHSNVLYLNIKINKIVNVSLFQSDKY